MLKQRSWWCVVVVGFLGTSVPLCAQTVTPTPTLDLNHFMGAWYEIAHLPNKKEKRCVADEEVLFALADKPARFQVVNTCRLKDGSSFVRNSNGRIADKHSTDGKLKVASIFPFSKKYWVLALGPDYAWSLVGSPDHKALWILSRTPIMPAATLSAIEAQATAQGFNSARLVTVPQHH